MHIGDAKCGYLAYIIYDWQRRLRWEVRPPAQLDNNNLFNLRCLIISAVGRDDWCRGILIWVVVVEYGTLCFVRNHILPVIEVSCDKLIV